MVDGLLRCMGVRFSLVVDKFRTVSRRATSNARRRGTYLALRTEEGYEACRASASIRLFFNVVAEDEAEFKYASELALIGSGRTKDISNGVVA